MQASWLIYTFLNFGLGQVRLRWRRRGRTFRSGLVNGMVFQQLTNSNALRFQCRGPDSGSHHASAMVTIPIYMLHPRCLPKSPSFLLIFSFSIFRFLLPSAQCPSNPLLLLPIFSKFRLLCSSIHAHRFIAFPSTNSVIFKQQIPLLSRIHSSIGQSIAPCFHNPPMFASPTKSTIYVKYAFVRISPSVAFLFYYGNFTYVSITRISC